jgi:hypothetical protein
MHDKGTPVKNLTRIALMALAFFAALSALAFVGSKASVQSLLPTKRAKSQLYSPHRSSAAESKVERADNGDGNEPIFHGCTIFAASFGDTVLFGNNVDDANPNTFYWVERPSTGDYGVVYLGFNEPQGGINEKGLAFDTNGLPAAPLNPRPELRYFPGGPTGIIKNIMRKCSTVEEAIELAQHYNWGPSLDDQWLLADASGDAVVISAGPVGELAFTRKQPGDGFLVSTNFNRAYPSGRINSWRYNTATKMLAAIEQKSDLTVDYARSVLDAVHQEGVYLSKEHLLDTQYSNIFDLRSGTIYLYYWHQFDTVITVDVADEISRAPYRSRVRDLFPAKIVSRAADQHQAHWNHIHARTNAAKIWLALVLVSLAFLTGDLVRRKSLDRGPRMAWLPIVALLGPMGLAAYWVSYRQPVLSPSSTPAVAPWRCALGATSHSVTGNVAGLAVVVVVFAVVFPEADIGPIILVAPLLVGWLLFRTPLITSQRDVGYSYAARRSLFTEFISTNLVLAGAFPVAFLLLNSLHGGAFDGTGANNLLFWGAMSLTGLAGGLVLFPFNLWLARRGMSYWPGGTDNGDTVPLPTLRNTWAALPLSILFLVAALGMTLSKGV